MKLFPQNVISRIKIALAPIIKIKNILDKFGDTINSNINKNGLIYQIKYQQMKFIYY